MHPTFACDAMLGGLARWLRAAGYETFWQSGVDDHGLIQLSRADGRTLLSSDSGIFLHAIVRDGVVLSLFVPLGLTPPEQLSFVLDRLGLSLREPRCMKCGGALVEISKDGVADRVPPRTFAWLTRYWECCRCKKLYWHGTHGERIEKQLRKAAE